MEKPLYNVNVGDLGTNPESMDAIMDVIVEYAHRWDAIILIDEVDIFLEEREFSNVLRNALVSTFLKFLEYNKGIIFLTTNRVKNLDVAVKSRVNLFLSYESFTSNKRKDVWKSLLKKWDIGISNKYLNKLSEFDLNGREIRNYMKIVFSIHKDRGIELYEESIYDILKECYELTNEFDQSIQKSSLYL